jgi:hypothetical protein
MCTVRGENNRRRIPFISQHQRKICARREKESERKRGNGEKTATCQSIWRFAVSSIIKPILHHTQQIEDERKKGKN